MGIYLFTVSGNRSSCDAPATNPICSKYKKIQCRINEKNVETLQNKYGRRMAADAICEPRFQRATVLAHVCKISTFAGHAKLFFEAPEPPNAAPVRSDRVPSRPCLLRAPQGPLPKTLAARQTLHVCGEMVWASVLSSSLKPSRSAKHYACALRTLAGQARDRPS